MNISFSQMGVRFRQMGIGGMLKSTQDRLERQEKTEKQVAFFEKQKENLKNVKCETVEEIAEKLKAFHSYEDQIAAVKAAYNQEQMFHILDESTERGEKIAEAAKKMEPKTPEERQEELVKEALGIEEDGGIMEDVMDEMKQVVAEMEEHVAEELTQDLTTEAAQAAQEAAADVSSQTDKTLTEQITEELAKAVEYKPFDVRM